MKLIPVGLAVLLAVSGFAQEKTKNPDIENIGHRDINRGQINLISADKENAMGRQLAAEYEREVKLDADPDLNEYINRICQRIVVNSDTRVPVTFKVVLSDDVGARAFPGGSVYINTRTILSTENEAELAFVLAQQVAHIAARHTAESLTRMELLNQSGIPLLVTSDPNDFPMRDAAGQAVRMQFLQIDRSQVTEADFLGLQYLYKAGYDPGAAVTFLQKIAALEQKNPSPTSRMFSPTPPTANRIAATQKNIATILPVRAQNTLTTPEFEKIKAMLKNR